MSIQEKSANLDIRKPVGYRFGLVTAIFIGPAAREPMTSVAEVRAVAGRGLEGDRYFDGTGTFSDGSVSKHLTLIESEAVAAAERDYKVDLPGEQSRRNLLTSGIALNHLVGREFRIGDVRLRGIRLCE